MEHKLISTQSSKILTFFNEKGKDWFDYSEAKQALPASSDSALKQLLSDMVRRGLLMRLKKGLYYVIPYEEDADSFMPDWHLLAESLTVGVEHYIGYYSALHIHNLITQPSLKEQIVVDRQLRPSAIKVKDVTFQFIYHNKDHFFGAKRTWIDSYNKVLCSDLEKTILDCLFIPAYAGGMVEIAGAIYASKDRINFEKLLEYTRRFRSQAVIKRLGFILEILDIETDIIQHLQKMKSASYVLLDTELPKTGKMKSRWSINQNVETETIKSVIYT